MMEQTQPPVMEQYGRCVYTLPYLDATGNNVAVAISAKGRCLGELPFNPDTKRTVIRALWDLLAAIDPKDGA